MDATRPQYVRCWDLDDIQILRAKDGHGDGRTVEAYAAVFDRPVEVTDQHGHYIEKIHRSSFNRQIGLGLDRVGCYYHHGLTLYGTPASGVNSVPIGSPLDVRADSKGLRTVTRFNGSDFADSILEAIRNGDIKGYSFRGGIFKSDPMRIPKARAGASLPVVTRTELGLTEYGPTPTPVYTEAEILALRSLLDAIPAARTPPDQVQQPATPDPGPGDAGDQLGDPTGRGHSARRQRLALSRAIRERDLRHG